MRSNIKLNLKLNKKGQDLLKKDKINLLVIKLKRGQAVLNSKDIKITKSVDLHSDKLKDFIKNKLNKIINHENNKDLFKNDVVESFEISTSDKKVTSNINNLSHHLYNFIYNFIQNYYK